MKKIRLIRTTIIEYVPEPEYYPEGYTIEQIAKSDAQVTEDRELLFESCISDEVRYEIFDTNDVMHEHTREELIMD